MAVQKLDDQHEHTFSSYVRIRDVVLKTCLGRRSGERGSVISVLPARHDDDDVKFEGLIGSDHTHEYTHTHTHTNTHNTHTHTHT